MVTQEHCQRVCEAIGKFDKASDTDWSNVHDLMEALYYDIYQLHGTALITWEITSMMQYQFALSSDELALSVCTEFITELYTTYYYLEGIIPYVPKSGDILAFQIVRHALRCVILFYEHQLYIENPKEYENFKKYMHV